MISLLIVVIYFAFISLGLPDSLLGSAWPTMYLQFNVPVSFAGIVSMIIALGTIISSLFSDSLTKRFGAGKVTAVSTLLTALALLGFAFSNAFWMLCVFAIPYGLGAGSIDAALNNYVALHYKSKHMSWLHCMWGVGTIIGPSIMGAVLTGGKSWNLGYLIISIIQIALTAVLFISLPLWKKKSSQSEFSCQIEQQDSTEEKKALPLRKVIRIPGAILVMITFFCYYALESTVMLWASSYLVLNNGISEEMGALCASLFFIGITVGRFINGFISIKLDDTTLIRAGQGILALGVLVLFLPFGEIASIVGIVFIGLGCAPIYPCIIHSTPFRFGAQNSQALIGVQMASAYLGTCLMPPLFGLMANHISVKIFPIYLVVLLIVMVVMHELLTVRVKIKNEKPFES